MAGHGTFIAGLVRQHCASARLVIVPVMYGDGAADETDIIDALQRLLLWHWLGLRRSKDDHGPLDVVSLSLGYYHETPGTVDDEAGLFGAIRALQADGVCVVAAAGNGATTLPFWPAALAAGPHGATSTQGRVPVLSVGARNPNDGTVAAFSNTGRWVHTYRCGVAVVSTMPTTFDGSLRGGVQRAGPGRASGARHARPGRLLERVRHLERQLVRLPGVRRRHGPPPVPPSVRQGHSGPASRS